MNCVTPSRGCATRHAAERDAPQQDAVPLPRPPDHTCSATLLPAFRNGLMSSGARAIWLISSMSRPRSESGTSKRSRFPTRCTCTSPLRLPGAAAYRRQAWRVLALAAEFVWELVLASLRVAHDVLTPRFHMQPGVVGVPLSADRRRDHHLRQPDLADAGNAQPGRVAGPAHAVRALHVRRRPRRGRLPGRPEAAFLPAGVKAAARARRGGQAARPHAVRPPGAGPAHPSGPRSPPGAVNSAGTRAGGRGCRSPGRSFDHGTGGRESGP
jgi:hypothetical protein